MFDFKNLYSPGKKKKTRILEKSGSFFIIKLDGVIMLIYQLIHSALINKTILNSKGVNSVEAAIAAIIAAVEAAIAANSIGPVEAAITAIITAIAAKSIGAVEAAVAAKSAIKSKSAKTAQKTRRRAV